MLQQVCYQLYNALELHHSYQPSWYLVFQDLQDTEQAHTERGFLMTSVIFEEWESQGRAGSDKAATNRILAL